MMKKVSVIYLFFIFEICFGSIDNNKHNGHGFFNGLERDNAKQNLWVEESKFNVPKQNNVVDDVKISNVDGTNKDLLDNSDPKLEVRHSSLYLQPEPRGLHYLLNTADYSPFLGQYLRRKRGLRLPKN